MTAMPNDTRGMLAYRLASLKSNDVPVAHLYAPLNQLPRIGRSHAQDQNTLPRLSSLDFEAMSDYSDQDRSMLQTTRPQSARLDRRGVAPRNTVVKAERAKADRNALAECLQAYHDYLLTVLREYEMKTTQSKSNGKKSGLIIGKEEVLRTSYVLLEYALEKVRRQHIEEGTEDDFRCEMLEVIAKYQRECQDGDDECFKLPKSSVLLLDGKETSCECVKDENSSACAVHYANGQTPGNKPDWRHCRLEHRRQAFKINKSKQLEAVRRRATSQRVNILAGRL